MAASCIRRTSCGLAVCNVFARTKRGLATGLIGAFDSPEDTCDGFFSCCTASFRQVSTRGLTSFRDFVNITLAFFSGLSFEITKLVNAICLQFLSLRYLLGFLGCLVSIADLVAQLPESWSSWRSVHCFQLHFVSCYAHGILQKNICKPYNIVIQNGSY